MPTSKLVAVHQAHNVLLGVSLHEESGANKGRRRGRQAGGRREGGGARSEGALCPTSHRPPGAPGLTFSQPDARYTTLTCP
jgi:hypothetical protein